MAGAPRSAEPVLVRGKAAPLGRVAAGGRAAAARIPAGIVIPAGAVDEDAVAAAYAPLGEHADDQARPWRCDLALDEDGAGASFAGQNLTLRPVTGAAAVLDAARRCRASMPSSGSSSYCDARGLPGALMVVLVQRFVEAEASAVAVSANPVTGDRDDVVIEDVRGAGQALMDGTVIPERTTFDRVARRAASPAITMLSAAQVRKVATLAVTLKALERHPVDLECAYKRDVLQLLQCRSVTTLASA